MTQERWTQHYVDTEDESLWRVEINRHGEVLRATEAPYLPEQQPEDTRRFLERLETEGRVIKLARRGDLESRDLS